MPSEVSIAGADHDREPSLEEFKRELAEAREQQAASRDPEGDLKLAKRPPARPRRDSRERGTPLRCL
jgi:hypothetical protein